MPVEGDGNPIIAAAAEGAVSVVALLLDRGARIDEVVPGDENALIQASGNGHLDVVISRNGADTVVATVGPGEILGEVSFIDGSPRSVSVKAGEQYFARVRR